MAKRGRSVSLDGLVARLSALDKERVDILRKLSGAISALGGEHVPWPFRTPGSVRPLGSGTTNAKPGRKRKSKMSAAGRAAIAAAQKKRWAKIKKAKDKKRMSDGGAVGNA